MTYIEPSTTRYSSTKGKDLVSRRQKVREFVESETPSLTQFETPAKWLEAADMLIEAADEYSLEFRQLGMRIARDVAELKSTIVQK